ncbi:MULTISPECIES: membrane protein [Spongiibacter]|jgi:uncharacterized membrane protein|uniref:DUF4870 family protein n=1 Tax=Spongiibacter TaxID=630749 RepID=UPI000413DD0C|nr:MULTISPECIES: membrane protein [Spongiibacter]MAK45322.1 hypothetical protein [Spongiibacter sp.]MBM7422600.1 putative membrane protein [Spongiibacter marinus]MEE2652866.1 hypothetical protein [Pseudomonadota bacterium]
MTQAAMPSSSAENMAKVVYVLYLVSLVFGITAIVAVVIAYINRDDCAPWLRSHYQFQIRTFWIGALYVTLGTVLSLVLVGWLILFFCLIWLVVRCIKGLKALDAREPYPDPLGWLF